MGFKVRSIPPTRTSLPITGVPEPTGFSALQPVDRTGDRHRAESQPSAGAVAAQTTVGAGAAAVASAAPAGGEGPPAVPAAGAGQAFGGGRSNVVNMTAPPPDFLSQFNWNSPIRLSPHNPGTVYVGGRQLFISRDRGETWTISPSVGKNIDVGKRQILEQSYALPVCGGAGRGAPHGQACILSKHDGYSSTNTAR